MGLGIVNGDALEGRGAAADGLDVRDIPHDYHPVPPLIDEHRARIFTQVHPEEDVEQHRIAARICKFHPVDTGRVAQRLQAIGQPVGVGGPTGIRWVRTVVGLDDIPHVLLDIEETVGRLRIAISRHLPACRTTPNALLLSIQGHIPAQISCEHAHLPFPNEESLSPIDRRLATGPYTPPSACSPRSSLQGLDSALVA